MVMTIYLTLLIYVFIVVVNFFMDKWHVKNKDYRSILLRIQELKKIPMKSLDEQKEYITLSAEVGMSIFQTIMLSIIAVAGWTVFFLYQIKDLTVLLISSVLYGMIYSFVITKLLRFRFYTYTATMLFLKVGFLIFIISWISRHPGSQSGLGITGILLYIAALVLINWIVKTILNKIFRVKK